MNSFGELNRFLALGIVGFSMAAGPLAGHFATAMPDQEPSPERPLAIGFQKQLLVDDHIVAQRANVSRELGGVTKANGGKPLIVADRPWENADLIRLGAVFRDGGRFRMWYQMNDTLFGYAESEDGLRWTKPNLGFYEHAGSKDNNIVDSRGLTCFLDPHETDPAHRYKAAYAHESVKAALAGSPDGFHWTPYNRGEPVTHRAADTINQLLWDEEARVYRLYTRTDFGQGMYAGTLEENRGTRDMINPDVKTNPAAWKTVREWKFDREGRWEYKRRQVYSLNGWIHEGVHFGLLWCYEWAGALGEGPYDLQKKHERDVMNFYIATMRGDAMWDLSWVYAEKPLIPRGPDGSFDKDWVQPAPSIVTWQDQHWLYYSGSKERHDIYRIREGQSRWGCSIGLATLRLDGFVCLMARTEPGTVVTKPFTLEGSQVEINADARNGELLVEVLDETGQPMPGFTRREAVAFKAADGLRLQPRWEAHGDLEPLKGKVVRFGFHLQNARLYAFQVVPPKARGKPMAVRDLMWVWGNPEMAEDGAQTLAAFARAGPAQRALLLGVPNIVMAGQGVPGDDHRADAFARPVAEFKRLVWEIAPDGEGGGPPFVYRDRLARIRRLADRYPQIEGVLLDDMSTLGMDKGFKPEHIRHIRELLPEKYRSVKIWGVVYTMSLNRPGIGDLIEELDVINLWTWHAKDIMELEKNVARCERSFPGKAIVLGLYLYDYGGGRRMPLDLLQRQCEAALKLAHAGRIQGMVFLTISDDPEAVSWTAGWIERIGGQELGARSIQPRADE
ncbi:MAG: hypothetical protein HY717_00725 [Planctomycetes bacterium]|nr:hypothetical protein [Planctomycetota bacterium]